MRRLPHHPEARVPLREGLFCHAVPMDIDDDGLTEYLLVIRDDTIVLRGICSRLVQHRHVGGTADPTLLSQSTGLATAGPISRSMCSAALLGRPYAFLCLADDRTVWLNECELECGVRLFKRAAQIGLLEMPADSVIGPISIALVDFDGTGVPDLVGGCFAGYPDDYFPPNLGRKYDAAPWPDIVRSRHDGQGRWRGGDERGYLYRFRNTGTCEEPAFEGGGTPLLDLDGKPLEFFGVPSICPVDLDSDGDTDFVCSQCNDTIQYIENIGTPNAPQYIDRGPVRDADGDVWHVSTRHSQTAAAVVDPAGNTRILLDNARFSCMPFLGIDNDGMPRFGPEAEFCSRGGDVRGKGFAVPVPVDWDGDADWDLIVGSEEGDVEFIENTGTAAAPVFAAPVPLIAGGKPIRIVPGPEGNVQGPQEAGWGYVNPAVGDWTDNGAPDLILGSSLGLMFLFRNSGRGDDGMPVLEHGAPLQQGTGDFETVWRQRPAIADIDGDGRTELIALNPLGQLTIYRKTDPDNSLVIDAGTAVLDPDGNPYKLDGYDNSSSVLAGRTKLWLADVTGNGTWDVLFGIIMGRTVPVPTGAKITEVHWIENTGTVTKPAFGRICRVSFNGWPLARGRHTPAACAVDLDGDGKLEMLVGIDGGDIMMFEASELDFERQPLPGGLHPTG
tara:strand:- start:602 stop:2614 length:2013 start_codon:yes stop_codon:yes gene_type:complete